MKMVFRLLFLIGSAYLIVCGVISFCEGVLMPESAGLGAWASIGGGMILIGIGLIVLLTYYILKKKSIL